MRARVGAPPPVGHSFLRAAPLGCSVGEKLRDTLRRTTGEPLEVATMSWTRVDGGLEIRQPPDRVV